MHDAIRQGQLSLFYTLYAAKNDLNIANTVSEPTNDLLHVNCLLFSVYVTLKNKLYHLPSMQSGATPLHLAAKYGHTELVRCLCTAGCDLDPVTEDGFMADEVASNSGYEKLATLIHHLRQVKNVRIHFILNNPRTIATEVHMYMHTCILNKPIPLSLSLSLSLSFLPLNSTRVI